MKLLIIGLFFLIMIASAIAQDEKSSVVFGMPKVAIESGCIDKILPLDEISNGIIRFITG